MTYYTGTGSASTIQTQLRTTIPANAAWSLIESTAFGASAYAADVYKCDHTVSGLSADFYVMVLLNGANLYLGIAEGYNVATHKPIRPAMVATSSLVTLQADGGIIPATTELDWYEGTSGGVTVAAVKAPITTTASATFTLTVAKDLFTITAPYVSTGIFAFAHVGAYDTDLGSDDPLPIMVSAGSANKAYSTRHPRRGGLSTGYACNLNGAVTSDGNSSVTTPTTDLDFTPLAAPGSTSGDGYDIYRGSDPGAARVAVLNSYGTTSGIGRATNGWRRGWLRHVRYTPTTGLAFGDTVSIDGVRYFYTFVNGLWTEMDPE